jgi:hypothetical protein
VNHLAPLILALASNSFAQPADEQVRALAAAHPAVASVAHTYTSSGNRQIPILRLSKAGGGVKVPAILLVAGIDARHRVGTDMALAVAKKLAEAPPAWLDHAAVFVIPCLNPDAFVLPLTADFGRLPLAYDADRDRRTNEDPAEDLNGDGLITLMRVKDPKPGSGLTATLCDDVDKDSKEPPAFPGLMRAPDASKGERAVYAVLAEGIDNDKDGKYNEDGPGPEGFGDGGGLDLDRNFPIHWPQFDDGSGDRPLQTPESLGLVNWIFEHPEIATVVVFGLHDTVINIPPQDKFDPTGQVPLGILPDDKSLYEAVSTKYRERTGATNPGENRPSLAGSFAAWTYGALGLPTFETPVWLRPDLVAEAQRPKPPEPLHPVTAPTDPAAPKTEAPAEKPRPEPKTDDQKWRRFIDDFGGPLFVQWTPFNHPTLGPVEIGGFAPGRKNNPHPGVDTDKELARLTEAHAAFLSDLAASFPVLESTVTAERLGPGLWKVRARITNTGGWSTQTAMSARTRTALPTSLSLSVPPAQIVSGNLRQSVDRLAAHGGTFDTEWTVLTKDGETLSISLTSPLATPRTLSVELK